MDKQTLSNYGWLVIVTLILAVMLALATPFGTYVGDAVVSVANGFVGTSANAIDDDNIENLQNKWNDKLNNNVNSGSGTQTPNTPDTSVTCPHTNTKTEGAITVSCTANGHTGKTVCIDCGETISTDSTISALGHTTNNGFCNNCNANVKVTSFQIQLEYPNYETFQMDEGMTFGEWCLSVYNTRGFYASVNNAPCIVLDEYDNGIFTYIGGSGSGFVYDTDLIESGHQYILTEGGHNGGGMN